MRSQTFETLENFRGGKEGGIPSGWTGYHHKATSALAVPFEAPSLNPGATPHFAQSQNEHVRIFRIDELRPLMLCVIRIPISTYTSS